MIITVKKIEHIIPKEEVNEFIAELKQGTEFSIRETSPLTYERRYIK